MNRFYVAILSAAVAKIAGANAIRCGKLPLITSPAVSCNHESAIRRISGFLIFSKCNHGAANSTNFTSPIPRNEANPQTNAKITNPEEANVI